MNKSFSLTRSLIATPHVVWCVLFVLAPLAFVVYYAFTDTAGAFTLNNIQTVFSTEYLRVFLQSIYYSLIATAICLLIAYPLAYCIAQAKERFQTTLVMMLMLPMWINLLIRTYSLKILLEENGLINRLLSVFGIEPITMLGTGGAIVLGMVYNYLPYMVIPIYTVLAKIDRSVLEASRDLGCNTLQSFFRVVMPLSISGVISGITMVFVPSISTFFISQSLSDGRIRLVGDIIEQQIGLHTTASYNLGSAISFILMILILISMFVTNRFGDKDGEVAI